MRRWRVAAEREAGAVPVVRRAQVGRKGLPAARVAMAQWAVVRARLCRLLTRAVRVFSRPSLAAVAVRAAPGVVHSRARVHHLLRRTGTRATGGTARTQNSEE